jgi:hypothetical protein
MRTVVNVVSAAITKVYRVKRGVNTAEINLSQYVR